MDCHSCSPEYEVANQRDGSNRIHSVDFLRGVVLTIVLIDHIDFFAGEAGFFRKWTLMGWGFSDAAEAFVFLSGFTFGWVYLPRLARAGFWRIQRRVLRRTLQIYLGYLTTLAIVLLIDFCGSTGYPPIRITELDSLPALQNTVCAALSLRIQPFTFGILCFYVVVLPFMPITLAYCQRCWWGAIAASAMLYLGVQWNPRFNLFQHGGSDWYFNPFAWQFLMVIGLAFGCRTRTRHLPRLRSVAAVAMVVIGYAAMIQKGIPLISHADVTMSHELTSLVSWTLSFVGKPNLAPLRLLHFLTLAYLVALVVPKCGRLWITPIGNLFQACGRHSLTIYCTGIILAYLSRLVFQWLTVTHWTLWVVVIDACLVQFAVALLLDRRSV